jgi:hypothetical protein
MASLGVALLLGLFLLLTSTTAPLPSLEIYDSKRILQFGLLFLLTVVPIVSSSVRVTLGDFLARTPRWLKATVATLFAWGLGSALLHAESWSHLANSLADVALPALLLYSVCVIAACRQLSGVRFDRVALGLVGLAGVAIGVQELAGVLAARSAGVDFNYWLSLMYFAHPRFYNQVQSWTIPMLAALPLVFQRSRLVTALCFTALALNWFIVLMTGARGTFLGVTGALVATSLLFPAARGHLLKWQILGLAGGAVIFAGALLATPSGFDRSALTTGTSEEAQTRSEELESRRYIGDLPKEGNRFLDTSLGRPLFHAMGRVEMWHRALNDALENPVFGIGPMAYPCSQSVTFAHPHNYPLQIAAEWGLPAAILLCLSVALLLWAAAAKLYKNQSGAAKNDHRASVALFTGVIAAVLHSGVSGVAVMPASQVAGILICGMVLGRLGSFTSRPPPKYRRQGLLFGMTLGLSACLLAYGSTELYSMDRRNEQMPPDIGHPRMWRNAFVCRLGTTQTPVTK